MRGIARRLRLRGPGSSAAFLAATLCLVAPAAAPLPAAEAPRRLGDSVREALARHPALAEAARQADAADARLRQARAEWRPTLALQGSAVQQGPTVSLSLPFGLSQEMVPGSRYDLRVGADYLLADGGLRSALVAQGVAGVEGAQSQEAVAREQVAFAAATAHLAVLRAGDQLQVAREARRRQEAHRAVALSRFEAGAVPKLDLLRADADLAAARADEVAAESALAIAEAGYNRALGRPANAPVSLAPLAEAEAEALTDERKSVERALAARPEFAALAARRALAKAQERQASSDRNVRARLTAGVVQQTETVTSKPNAWSVGVSVSRSLWDGGRSQSREEAARADAEAVDAGIERARQEVAVSVRQVLLEDAGARARLKSAEEEVAAAEEGLRVARIAYEAGLRTSVYVTDAQVALTRARTRRVNARYDVALARARWAYAVGEATKLVSDLRQ